MINWNLFYKGKKLANSNTLRNDRDNESPHKEFLKAIIDIVNIF